MGIICANQKEIFNQKSYCFLNENELFPYWKFHLITEKHTFFRKRRMFFTVPTCLFRQSNKIDTKFLWLSDQIARPRLIVKDPTPNFFFNSNSLVQNSGNNS